MSDDDRALFVSAADGLRLYARDYGPIVSDRAPIICLSGLSRNSSDFHNLALALSRDKEHPRRVLALDYRGRGRSEWADDWRQYDVRVELNDTFQVLTAAGIDKAIFVGTSRGGLIIMAMAALRPTLLKAAILNDVGPVIEAKGLLRIRGYVGRLPAPRDFSEAGHVLKQLSDAQFPRWTDEQWEKMARRTWTMKDGRLVPTYDSKLLKTLDALDLEAPLPTFWPLFEGLKDVPVLAIRGENSDLLSQATFERMQAVHPDLTAVTVPDQGHAPEFEGDLIRSVRDFIAAVESVSDRDQAA